MNISEEIGSLKEEIRRLKDAMQVQTAQLGSHTLHDDRQWNILNERMNDMHLENQEMMKDFRAETRDVMSSLAVQTSDQTQMLQTLVNAKKVSIGAAKIIKSLAAFIAAVGGAVAAAYAAWRAIKG